MSCNEDFILIYTIDIEDCDGEVLFMENALKIIKDPVLTYGQKVLALAKEAEDAIEVLNISDRTKYYMENEVICDMFEGNAPYRPRYILPDYALLMDKGCSFLNLEAPTNIWEATHTLLMFYNHVPSITSYPVYLGNIDTLLEPFIEDEKEAEQAIRLFLTHIDRTITDSFCHANIGPLPTKAGNIILKVERELKNAVPNITLKVSDETTEQFLSEAVKTALTVAKPSFANHQAFAKDLGEQYGIASCYNGLYIGGGAYTLVRMNLAKLAMLADSKEAFMNSILEDAVKEMCSLMDERIGFLVEESGFFETHFLIKENFIKQDRFSAMFGLVGLAQSVNILQEKEGLAGRFGHADEANLWGEEIIKKMESIIDAHSNPHCVVSDGKYLLHAQVGLDTDDNISPGCRVPIGDEPELYQQISAEAPFHKYFPSGIGNIYPFEKTAYDNPKHVLDIMRGAFDIGMRYFSVYSSDSDVVRITGYLVKLSDIEKLRKNEQVVGNSVVLGMGAVDHQHILEREVRK